MKAALVLWINVLFFNPVWASTPFERFDQAYRERRDFKRFHVALDGYRTKWRENPGSAEAGWRNAMACSFLGLRVESEEDKIALAFEEGKDVALAALAKDPQCVACHFWRAINQVLHAKTVGVLKMLFSLGEIRDHLRFVADHAPDFHHGAALRFLALIDWKLPGIFGGDNDRAKNNFVMALKYGPEEPLNYQVYFDFLKDEGDGEQAAEILRRGAELPMPESERVESTDALAALKELWATRRVKYTQLN